MSARTQPARLWLRPASSDRAATWIVRDAGRQISTSCGALNIDGAQSFLETYLATKRIGAELPRSAPAHKVFIADVLRAYVTAKHDGVTRTKELLARVERLLGWWRERTLAAVTTENCNAYAKQRTTPAAARRELEDLRAAINLAVKEGVCRDAVSVTLPPRSKGRTRYYTREQAAKLLWTAWKYREKQNGAATDKRPTKHVARFILVALYSASRSARVYRASFYPENGRPWVDVENGLYYREAPDEQAPDNKRAPPLRIPGRLLAHMRRWKAMGARYVVEYQGRAADPKKAFARTVERAGMAGTGAMRHTFRHTSVTWLLQSGESTWDVSGFSGMSEKTLRDTYGHHHPDHQKSVGDAFSTGRAGRVKNTRATNR